MKVNLFSSLLFIGLLFTACTTDKKEDEPKPEPAPAERVESKDTPTPAKKKIAKAVERVYDAAMVAGKLETTSHVLTAECFYNAEGKLIKRVYTGSEGGAATVVYKYNDKGLLVEESSTGDDADDRIVYTKYDGQGNPTEGLKNGVIRITLKYNDKGEPVQRIEEGNFSESESYEYREYDAQGNWTKMILTWDDEEETENGYSIVLRELTYN